MISWLSFYFYRLILAPTGIFLIRLAHPVLRGKLRDIWNDRQQKWPELSARPIWIHAASGEIEYAKPLLRALKEQWPQRNILLTYTSPSVKGLMRNVLGVDALVPLPWDLPLQMQKFFKHFQPEYLLVARSDVWPEMIYQARQNKVPAMMFAATFAAGSSRRWFFLGPLTRFTFNQLKCISCVSIEDASEIRKLGVKCQIEISGDTRYDQVLWRLRNPAPCREELRPNSRPVLVAGSTWPDDENILLPAVRAFLQKGGRLILAPHEIGEQRMQDLVLDLSALGYTWTRYSKAEKWGSEKVLVIDQIGVLPEMYMWGDFAFVGGSFSARVHSVMEPLAAGLPVIVGPFHLNNREAIHFQDVQLLENSTLPAVNVVQDTLELEEVLKKLMAMLPQLPERKKWLQDRIREKQGATAEVLKLAGLV
jgi:3-deoxy-D-manno-octulosonic-acid transferase